jgi:addiction module HigA family antidote
MARLAQRRRRDLRDDAEHLAEELITLEVGAAELARQLEGATNRSTEIFHRRGGITGDTALRRVHFFGTTAAEFWLNLPSRYKIRQAQHQAGKSIRY